MATEEGVVNYSEVVSMEVNNYVDKPIQVSTLEVVNDEVVWTVQVSNMELNDKLF